MMKSAAALPSSHALQFGFRTAWDLYYRAIPFADLRKLHMLLRFRDLRSRFYDDLWRQAAAEIGAQIERTSHGYLRIGKGNLAAFVDHHKIMLDDHLTLNLMGNKALTYELMVEKGIPVPSHVIFSLGDMQQAVRFFEQQSGPVVVKPARGTGAGRGVTTAISDVRTLRRAARLAARHDTMLIAEQQIEGASFRLLFLDGVMIDAIRRDPPRLRGNSNSTIRQLVRAENRHRLSVKPYTALSPLVIDMECQHTLAAQGLGPNSRLADGQSVIVKRAANENTASENIRVIDEVNPLTAEIGSQLVNDLGIRLAGLDILCRDISVPLTPDNGYFGEVNTTPGLHHHYLVSRRDDGVRVAQKILDHLFTSRSGVIVI